VAVAQRQQGRCRVVVVLLVLSLLLLLVVVLSWEELHFLQLCFFFVCHRPEIIYN
jgi:hypothetical protein